MAGSSHLGALKSADAERCIESIATWWDSPGAPELELAAGTQQNTAEHSSSSFLQVLPSRSVVEWLCMGHLLGLNSEAIGSPRASALERTAMGMTSVELAKEA